MKPDAMIASGRMQRGGDIAARMQPDAGNGDRRGYGCLHGLADGYHRNPVLYGVNKMTRTETNNCSGPNQITIGYKLLQTD